MNHGCPRKDHYYCDHTNSAENLVPPHEMWETVFGKKDQASVNAEDKLNAQTGCAEPALAKVYCLSCNMCGLVLIGFNEAPIKCPECKHGEMKSLPNQHKAADEVENIEPVYGWYPFLQGYATFCKKHAPPNEMPLNDTQLHAFINAGYEAYKSADSCVSCETLAKRRGVYDVPLAPAKGGSAIAEKPAHKDDADKPRYDLIPSHALNEYAQVLTFGATKYEARNWEKGLSWGRVFAALMRHCWAWMSGQDRDPETGLHHMAHAAFGCFAIVEYYYMQKGEDDRPGGAA